MFAQIPLRLKAAVFLAVLLVAIDWNRVRVIENETEREDEAASARSMLLARAFAERARTVVQKVNHTLEIASTHWDSSEAVLQARVNEVAATLGAGSSRVEFLDTTGVLRAGAQGISVYPENDVVIPVPPIATLSEKKWTVSDPVPGPSPGSWRVRFSRPVIVKDQMVGIASVILDPHVCLTIRDELDLAEADVVAMLRSDGTLLARAPALEVGIGRRIVDAGFLRPGVPDSGSLTRTAPIDGVIRKNGWYKPADLPLVFVVGLSIDAAFAQLRQRERRVNLVSAFVAALLLLAGVLAVRAREQEVRRSVELGADKERLESEVESRTQSLRKALDDVRSTQQALDESEQRGRLILENTLDLIAIYKSVEGRMRVVYRSPSFTSEFPLEKHEGGVIRPRVHPDDAARVRSVWRSVLRGKSPVSCEYRVVPEDGAVHWIQTTVVLVRRPDGTIEGAVAVGRDVTLRAQAELRLRESEERLRQITDYSGDLISLFSLDGKRLYTSPSYLRYFPETPTDLAWDMHKGTRPREQDRSHLLQATRKAITEGTPQRLEFCLILEGGEERWFEGDVRAIYDTSDRPYRVLSVCRDITERRDAEQKVRELQRLDAIGQLTGGLAHDFNNMLGLVLGNMDMLGDRLPADPLLRRHYDLALGAALRAVEVTRVLLAVARRQPMDISRADINALIRDMLPLVHASAGASVRISSDLCEGVLDVDLDVSGLNNVILNLVINACDAMRGIDRGRELKLSTRREDRHAVIEVQDNGCGMNEEVRLRALEPFFTTKEPGQGTGLGLSMAKGYAEQLGGGIAISSVPERGTMVSVRLPLSGHPAFGASPSLKEADSPPRVQEIAQGLRILVVDDEPGLCELACTWLAALGHAPVGVHDAGQALARLPEGFDLLFTDVVMPGTMDGIALAREALKRRPGVKVLLTSGYARDLIGDVNDLPGPLLGKPYRRADLVREIARLSSPKPEKNGGGT